MRTTQWVPIPRFRDNTVAREAANEIAMLAIFQRRPEIIADERIIGRRKMINLVPPRGTKPDGRWYLFRNLRVQCCRQGDGQARRGVQGAPQVRHSRFHYHRAYGGR